MGEDLRHRYARLEYEQGQLWNLVDQVHVGPVSPDKDLVAAIADTIKQATDAWRERAEKAEEKANRMRDLFMERCAAIERAQHVCRKAKARKDAPGMRLVADQVLAALDDQEAASLPPEEETHARH